MKFHHHKRRAAPAIIIISLIDILIVILIFLMVTTTFKQTPAVKLTLPESKQPRQGATADAMLVVTVAKAEPHFYMDTRPVTLARLSAALMNSTSSGFLHRFSTRMHTGMPVE